MDLPVLCFDRDNTIDVNPSPEYEPVPLSWVQYYAHFSPHDTWKVVNSGLCNKYNFIK